jgi:hypothetical protein
MSESTTTPVTCGRCANLWKRTRMGFGVCACAARREKTGEIHPEVALDATCEFALLSAKLDPDFMPRVYQARRENLPAEFIP